MPYESPLNPQLLRAMRAAFDNVIVRRPGELLSVSYTQVYSRVARDMVRHGTIKNFGEEYAICCPYCRDNRWQFVVNHVYRVRNQKIEGNPWSPVNCFANGCHTKSSVMDALREQLAAHGYEWIKRLPQPQPRRITVGPIPDDLE